MNRNSKQPSSTTPKQATGKAARARLSRDARGAVIAVCGFLFVMVLLVFGRSVWFEFLDFDDMGNVSGNPVVNKGLTLGGIVWAFSHSQVGDWIPLTTLSHMLDCECFGLWAGGHHLVNVLLHAANSVLLFLVLREMTGSLWNCAFVAALFALHPLRAESVAWISERKDVLSGLFFMLTLGAYTRWTRRPGGGFVWVAVFMALGLLCKTMLVTTPLVLLLLDLWPLQRTAKTSFSRLAVEKIPLFILSALAAGGQMLAAREGMLSVTSYPMARRAANAVVSCAEYVVQMVWPAGLSPFYPYPRNGVDLWALGGGLLLVGAISAAAFRWRRQAPWLVVGWLWYLMMLAPVLGLVQAGHVARADRYTYLPQIGLYVIVTWAVASLSADRRERRLVATCLAGVLLFAASLMAFRQTGFWQDTETVWNRALACTPKSESDIAHYSLGTALAQKGEINKAMDHFQKALEVNPGYVDGHINLGQAYLQLGKTDEAIAHYHQALEINPHYANAYYNIGVVLAQQGKVDEAITQYRKTLEIDPAHAAAQINLGNALFRANRIDEAIACFEAAVRIDSSDAKAQNNLAMALVQKDRIPEAIVHYEKALEIDPRHARACNSLAWLLATNTGPGVRNGSRAVELAERANQLTQRNNPLMLRTLAAGHAELGRFEEALSTARLALQLAVAQNHDDLARGLREDIECYIVHKPLR